MRSELTLTVLLLLLIASVWLYGAVFDASGSLSPNNIRQMMLDLGPAGPALYVALIAVAVVIVPIPSIPFVLVAGFVYGPLVALALTVLGYAIGALISFYLARRLGRAWVKRKLSKLDTMGIIDKFDTTKGFLAIFVLRLMPLFSFDIVSYAAGLTNMRVGKFILASALGIIPVTAVYTFLGGAAFQWNLTFFAAVFVIVLAFFAVAWVFREKVARVTGIDLEKLVRKSQGRASKKL